MFGFGLARTLFMLGLCVVIAAPAYGNNREAKRLYDQGMRDYRADKLYDAADKFSRACDLGHDRGCYNLAVQMRDGKGIPKDGEFARGLFQNSCQKGNNNSCYNFAMMAMNGQGGLIDDAAARTALETSCAGKVSIACNNLAVFLETGRGGAADPVRARALYKQSCDNDSAQGCVNYATLLVEGIGGAADPAAGRALLDAKCKAGQQASCEGLAELNAGALGKAPVTASADSLRRGIDAYNAENYTEAMRQLLPNAEAGDRQAQYLVGYMHTYGLSKERDYLAAADFLTRAGEQGEERAQELMITIAPNIAQAQYIDYIDRFGPDTSSLSAFSTDVAVYCTLRGPRCTEFRGQEHQWERAHNRAAEAANLRRIWNNYGMGESTTQSIARSRARSECLRQVAQSIDAQTRGRQQWRYVDNCG